VSPFPERSKPSTIDEEAQVLEKEGGKVMNAIQDRQTRGQLAKNVVIKKTFKNNNLTRIVIYGNDLTLSLLAKRSDMRKEAQCSTEKDVRVKERAQLVVQLSPLVTGNPAVGTMDHSAYPSSPQWVQLNFDIERDAVSLTPHAEKRPPVPGAICEQTSP